MSIVSEGLERVRARIAAACAAVGRDSSAVRLLAVSKTFPAEAVLEAVRRGQCAFGENYAQEGAEKRARLEVLLDQVQPARLPQLEWHFIGPIQSNKTRLIADSYDWVHSIDRLKIAQRLSDTRRDAARLQVCIQVNVSGEASKSGADVASLRELALAVAVLPGLRLRGLMCIPRPSPNPSEQRAQFRVLHRLREQLLGAGLDLDTLSMGMSEDLEAAIAEGATIVRVGRAIFGERQRR